jgi:ankyrin repeat protein
MTPLFWASRYCNLDNVKVALQKNKDVVDVYTPDGTSPLMITALQYEDHSGAIISELIKAGADINATAHDGRTAFIIAAASGHAEKIKLLKCAGAYVPIYAQYAAVYAYWRSMLRPGLLLPANREENKEETIKVNRIISDFIKKGMEIDHSDIELKTLDALARTHSIYPPDAQEALRYVCPESSDTSEIAIPNSVATTAIPNSVATTAIPNSLARNIGSSIVKALNKNGNNRIGQENAAEAVQSLLTESGAEAIQTLLTTSGATVGGYRRRASRKAKKSRKNKKSRKAKKGSRRR